MGIASNSQCGTADCKAVAHQIHAGYRPAVEMEVPREKEAI